MSCQDRKSQTFHTQILMLPPWKLTYPLKIDGISKIPWKFSYIPWKRSPWNSGDQQTRNHFQAESLSWGTLSCRTSSIFRLFKDWTWASVCRWRFGDGWGKFPPGGFFFRGTELKQTALCCFFEAGEICPKIYLPKLNAVEMDIATLKMYEINKNIIWKFR